MTSEIPRDSVDFISTAGYSQFERIVTEVTTLAKRIGITPPSAPEAGFDSARAVTSVIEWAFSFRAALVGVASAPRWRDSFSRIGPFLHDESDILTSEYQRSEMTIPEYSPLACYYPWLKYPEQNSVVRYTANGMSAVAAFLLGLAQWAHQRRQPITLITTPLYHETQQLLQSWMCEGLLIWQPHHSISNLLAALQQVNEPCALFLDSAETVDTQATIRQISGRLTPHLVAIAWDNTCVPFYEAISLTALPAPLFLLRSHLKLDQLGLEIGPLGSVTVVMASRSSSQSIDFLRGFLPRLPKHCQLLGVNASGDLLRRLHLLGLPDLQLTPIANAALVRANSDGTHALAEALADEEYIQLVEYPHRCFTALRLPNLAEDRTPSIALRTATELAQKLHRQAAVRGLPMFNSASFGFSFTAAIGFAASMPDGYAVPILRVAFGGHDPDVTKAIAWLVAQVVKQAYKVPQSRPGNK